MGARALAAPAASPRRRPCRRATGRAAAAQRRCSGDGAAGKRRGSGDGAAGQRLRPEWSDGSRRTRGPFPARAGARAPRPSRPGPASGGDRASGAGPLRRPGGERQDDHAGGPRGLARRDRRRPLHDRRHHVQHTRRRRAARSHPAGPRAARIARGDAVRVRTFHALGLEILRDAGRPPTLVARDRMLRSVLPGADAAARRRLDDAFSRLKLDLGVTAEEVATDPAPGPVAAAFVAYERALAAAGAIDFDDLVAGSPPGARGRPGPPGALADAVRAPPRRRGPGRRPKPASTGPPRWRRRRTASSSSATTTRASTAGGLPTCDACSGWRPSCPASGGSTCRQLPLPGTRARPGRPPRRAQSRAVREVDPAGTRRGRPADAGAARRRRRRPRPGSSRRCPTTAGGGPCSPGRAASWSRSSAPAWPPASSSGRTGCPCRSTTPGRRDRGGRGGGGPPGLAVAARVVAAARRGVAEAAACRRSRPRRPRAGADGWTAAEIAAAVTGWAVRVAARRRRSRRRSRTPGPARGAAPARRRRSRSRPRTAPRASSGTTSPSSA